MKVKLLLLPSFLLGIVTLSTMSYSLDFKKTVDSLKHEYHKLNKQSATVAPQEILNTYIYQAHSIIKYTSIDKYIYTDTVDQNITFTPKPFMFVELMETENGEYFYELLNLLALACISQTKTKGIFWENSLEYNSLKALFYIGENSLILTEKSPKDDLSSAFLCHVLSESMLIMFIFCSALQYVQSYFYHHGRAHDILRKVSLFSILGSILLGYTTQTTWKAWSHLVSCQDALKKLLSKSIQLHLSKLLPLFEYPYSFEANPIALI